MKIINKKSWFSQFISVVYYNIYLMGKPLGSGDINIMNNISLTIYFYFMAILFPILPLINNLLFFILSYFFISSRILFLTDKLLDKEIGDYKNTYKILKRKPKFFNSQVLSMIISMLFYWGGPFLFVLSAMYSTKSTKPDFESMLNELFL